MRDARALVERREARAKGRGRVSLHDRELRAHLGEDRFDPLEDRGEYTGCRLLPLHDVQVELRPDVEEP